MGCRLQSLALAALLVGSPGAQTNVWRINCGGSTVSAPSGPDFSEDVPYSPGMAGHVGGTDKSAQIMGGSWSDFLDVHETARIGWTAYRFDVPNGDYILRLHLAEAELHGALQRVFDLRAEGRTILDDLDLAARFGTRYGSLYATVVTVNDGRLDLTVGAGSSPPILNGVEVWTAPASGPLPPAVTGLSVKPGYDQNILTWEPIDDPTVVGYRVLRTSAGDSRNGMQVTGLGHNRTRPVPSDASDVWALPPRHFDETASLDRKEFYQVVAVDHLGRVGPAKQAVGSRAKRSSESDLDVYELLIDPLDWKHLNDTFLTMPDATVPGTLLHGGASFPCEVRYRGQTSLVLPKKSWKLKFAPGELFQGRKQINLKAHFADETMIRQELGMQMFRDTQGTAPDSSYLHFRVNGVYMGVFQRLEKINTDYLRARDRDDDGNVYSAQRNGQIELGPWTLQEIQQEFDQETNEGGSWSDLVQFIDVVNQTTDQDFPLEIARTLDLDGYLSNIAANGFLVDFEAVIRNYYLHHDLELDRWEVIPWDNDSSFSYPFIPIDFGTEGSWVGNNVLKTRVLDVPEYRWRYVEKLREILAGPATIGAGGELSQHIEETHGEILEDARADPNKRGWEDDTDFLLGPDFVLSAATARRNQLFASLDAYQPPTPPTSVWINELMAHNLSVVTDGAGDYDDWIELYNASSSAVDIGGMYLTDDLDLPTKWPIPAGTNVPADGYALFWADNEPAEGADHTTFKLRKEGELVALFDADGTTLLDVKHYNPQPADVSLGRTSDGGAFFRLLATPTPNAANTQAGNLPPRVTAVQTQPKAAGSSDPVRVGCLVKDADGLGTVELLWAPTGQAFSLSTMTAKGNDYYEATLPTQPAGTVVEYFVRTTDLLGKTASAPADAPSSFFSYGVADPQLTTLRINEFMPNNQNGITDEAGEREDWVEIVNAGALSVNLSGMYLSDDLENSTKWAFPLGTFLAPGAHLLVWADNEPGEGPLHATFSLSSTLGEEIGLFDSLGAGNEPIDTVTFGPLAANVSIGLLPDADTLRFRLIDTTPQAANVPPTGFVRYDTLQTGLNQIGLSTLAAPRIGTTSTFFVGGGPAFGAGLLVGGLTTANIPIPFGSVQLLVIGPALTTGFTLDAGGNATVLAPIPLTPALVGLPGFFQVLLGPNGSSNGVAATIGT